MNVVDSSRRTVTLGQELSRGGEGIIYAIPAQPDRVAKLYTKPAEHPVAKLAWMQANPPQDPSVSSGHSSIAWPMDLLYSLAGTFIGFSMPYVRNTAPMLSVFNPRLRAATLPDFNWRYLHRAARNLALAISALHARDYIVGDLNESNILVTPTALVTLIDTDSFQVRARAAVRGPARASAPVVYYCPVGRPEYTPPELQGKPFHNLLRQPEHDRFGLGVLIFQLLMEGSHPFRARYLGTGDPPSIEERIAHGWFPYASGSRGHGSLVAPPPNAPSLDLLSPGIVDLMQRCFVEGHRKPGARPTAQDWSLVLSEAEHALLRCPNGHYVSGHLSKCPHCGAVITSLAVPRRVIGGPVIADGTATPTGLGATGKQATGGPIPGAVHNIHTRAQSRSPTSTPWEEILGDLQAGARQASQWAQGVRNKMPANTPWHVTPAKSQAPSQSAPTSHTPPATPPPRPVPKTSPYTPAYVPPRTTRQPVAWGRRMRGIAILAIFALFAALVVIQGRQPCGWVDLSLKLSRCLHSMAQPGPAWGVEFSPDGGSVAAESLDHTIRVWRVADGSLRQTIPSQVSDSSEHGTNLLYSEDGSQLVSFAGDTLQFWRTIDGKSIRTQKLQTIAHWVGERITGEALSSEILAQAVCDPAGAPSRCSHVEVRLWRVSDGSLMGSLKARASPASPAPPLSGLALSPDGRWLGAGTCQAFVANQCNTGEVLLWRLADSRLLQDLKTRADSVSAMAFSSDGALLAAGAQDGSIFVWRVGDDTPIRRLALNAPVHELLFSTNGTELIAAAQSLAIWRIADGASLGDTGLNSDVLQIGLSPDGKMLAAVLADNRLVLWKLN